MHPNKLEQLVIPELDALGFELVKLELAGTRTNPLVRLYIDSPDGVKVSDCSRVSRAIGLLLESADPFPGRYLLEVSSPGSNRPLVTQAHFQRFAGEMAKATAKLPEGGKITYTGTIRSCEDGTLVLTTDDGELAVEIDHIISAQLVHREFKIDKKRTKEEKRPHRKRRGESS